VNSVQMRFKLGVGAGINRQFGAPEWRAVVGIEMFRLATKDGSAMSVAKCKARWA